MASWPHRHRLGRFYLCDERTDFSIWTHTYAESMIWKWLFDIDTSNETTWPLSGFLLGDHTVHKLLTSLPTRTLCRHWPGTFNGSGDILIKRSPIGCPAATAHLEGDLRYWVHKNSVVLYGDEGGNHAIGKNLLRHNKNSANKILHPDTRLKSHIRPGAQREANEVWQRELHRLSRSFLWDWTPSILWRKQ